MLRLLSLALVAQALILPSLFALSEAEISQGVEGAVEHNRKATLRSCSG